MIARTLHRLELTPFMWQHNEYTCLMHGHLSCLVALHKRMRDDNLKAAVIDDKLKVTTRSTGLPPQPPLTMLELILDAFPSFNGMRIFFIVCRPRPAAVLDAVKRRQRWNDYSEGDDASLVLLEKQLDLIVGAFFSTAHVSDIGEFEEIPATFGPTRQLPYEHVTEFMRAWADRAEEISLVLSFLGSHYRPVSWPFPPLRFKPGQTVWVSMSPHDWVRAIVSEINVPVNVQEGTQTARDVCTHVAAYLIRMVAKAHGNDDLLEKELPVAHDCDLFIRKKRPPPPPAPGPVPEDARVAWERREAQDRREAMERARELENSRSSGSARRAAKRRSGARRRRRSGSGSAPSMRRRLR
jgi:hypothetical protein